MVGLEIIEIQVLPVLEVLFPVKVTNVLLQDLSGALQATIEVLMDLPVIIPISKMHLPPEIIEGIQLGITVIGILAMAMELSALDLPIIEIQAIPEAILITTPIIPTETIATTAIVTPIRILREIPVAITQIVQAVTDLSVQEALGEVIEAVVEAAVVAEAVDNNLI